jgi:5-formyltetrahydrofolate cyclo-ligase
METKGSIRKQIFRLRKEASPEQLEADSRKIFARIRAMEEYRKAAAVYAYVDVNGEVMTREFIAGAWADGKLVAVPKVRGKDMTFYVLEDFGQLEAGYFGIPEPVRGREADAEDALMIVPGVAFDRLRHRIGYGQGFYDRYLSRHWEHFTVAAAFDFQIVDEVPAEPTDICPDRLVTESRIW